MKSNVTAEKCRERERGIEARLRVYCETVLESIVNVFKNVAMLTDDLAGEKHVTIAALHTY